MYRKDVMNQIKTSNKNHAGKQVWKAMLKSLIDEKKDRHAKRDKTVSTRTRSNREDVLFQSFKELHELGYKINDPWNFREKHFEVLLKFWLEKGLSPSHIQGKSSVLRTLCSWINKPGMIRTLEHYGAPKERIKRVQVAQVDKSWSTNGVTFEDKFKEIEAHDMKLAAQLLMMSEFGLRRLEAICFRPLYAMKQGFESSSIVIDFGTKGGRPRIIPIDSDSKRDAIQYALSVSKGLHGSIGWDDKTLKQAADYFSNTIRKFGLTKKELGVTSHGLRHQYLNDGYERITGHPSPVRGGEKGAVDPEVEIEARTRMTLEAGHSRTSITPAYYGSHRKLTKHG